MVYSDVVDVAKWWIWVEERQNIWRLFEKWAWGYYLKIVCIEDEKGAVIGSPDCKIIKPFKHIVEVANGDDKLVGIRGELLPSDRVASSVDIRAQLWVSCDFVGG